MKTAKDFEDVIKNRGPQFQQWNIHDCSICGYPCGYVFENGHVRYDSSCDCVKYGSSIKYRTYQEIADHYNMEDHVDCIKEMNKYWGFSDDL